MSNTQIIDHQKYSSFRAFDTKQALKSKAKFFSEKDQSPLEWLQNMEKDSILIEAGANIGINAIPSALMHVKKVVALEPDIHSYLMLIKNLELNNIPAEKVEALPLAVSTEYAGIMAKFCPKAKALVNSFHTDTNNFNDPSRGKALSDKKSRSVYCVSLAQIINQISTRHNGPIHVKINTNGSEEDACQSLFNEKIITRISSLQIEISDKIASHQRLIKRLETAGFYYSRELLNVNRKRSADLEYFSQVPFYNRAYYNSSNLPHNELRKASSKNSTIPSYFTLIDSTTVTLSRQPAASALKKALNIEACACLFHQVSINTIRRDHKAFEFFNTKKTKSQNQLRLSIKHSDIERESPQYIDELIKQSTSKSFVEKICKIVKTSSKYLYPKRYLETHYANPDNELLRSARLTCRIRHFLDLQGYSLDIHNDSMDTFCALVAPLIPYTTSTCIATGGFFDRRFKRQPDRENVDISDFTNNTLIDAKSSANTYVRYIKDQHKDKFLHQIPLTLQESELHPGEVFVIPNMTSYAFGNTKIDKELAIAKHILNAIQAMASFLRKEKYRPIFN